MMSFKEVSRKDQNQGTVKQPAQGADLSRKLSGAGLMSVDPKRMHPTAPLEPDEGFQSGRSWIVIWWERHAPWSIFFSFLVLILVTKWWAINQPPVWDTSMSVFPAALTITEQGLGVFDQPTYIDGGPNVHASSIITWITAGAFTVTEQPFPFLHLMQFLMTAAGLTAVWLLLRQIVSPWLAIATAAGAFMLPIVRTQAGYMYLEIPLMMAATWAVFCWVHRRPWLAGTFALIAVAVKPTGIIVAGSIKSRHVRDIETYCRC